MTLLYLGSVINGCSTVVLICFTCPAITVGTDIFERKILRSHDRICLLSPWLSSILLYFHDLGLQVQFPAWWSLIVILRANEHFSSAPQ